MGTPVEQLRDDEQPTSQVVKNILNEMETENVKDVKNQDNTEQYYDSPQQESYDSYEEYEQPLSFTDKLLREMKMPLLVVLLVFLSNFGYLNKLLVQYVPRIIGNDGNMNMYGLLLKAVFAGFLFFVVKKFIL